MSAQPAIKPIQKELKVKSESPTFWQEVEELMKKVECRAFELFDWRGRQIGNDLADWFSAERELFRPIAVDITEKNNRVFIRVETPGFNADELDINLDSDLLIVKGAKKEETEKKDEKTWHSESRNKQIFRRIVLPTRVDPEKAEATLKNGVLEISAPRAAEAKKNAINAA